VTGLSFCLAGVSIAFKSKSEFIAALLVAKIAKYLRSILIEPTILAQSAPGAAKTTSNASMRLSVLLPVLCLLGMTHRPLVTNSFLQEYLLLEPGKDFLPSKAPSLSPLNRLVSRPTGRTMQFHPL
jgi:hypothetical protein